MSAMKIACRGFEDLNGLFVGKDRVQIVAADGRTMFEVVCGDDGHSIEVRAVECCMVDKILYKSALTIEPNVTNSITIRPQRWEQG